MGNPQSEPTFLTACIIARDEEEHLPRCLLSLRTAVDEVVIIDTGSSDRTPEIALGLGARVFPLEWAEDFSAARNMALDFARGDWVLMIDADEELAIQDRSSLRALLGGEKDAYLLTVLKNSKDQYGQEGVRAGHGLRLFRNVPDRRYRGRINEELPYKGMIVGFSSVRIMNHRKSSRPVTASAQLKELRRLERWVAESPDDSLGHYFLGNESLALEDWEEGVSHLCRAWELLGEETVAHGPHLLRNLAVALRNLDCDEEALEYLREGAIRYHGYLDLEYLEGVIRLDREEHLLARECFLACLEQKEPALADSLRDVAGAYDAWAGIDRYLAWRGIGVCNRALGEREGAIFAFESALRDHPQDSYSLLHLGEILLEEIPPEQVLHHLESTADVTSPGVQAALHQLFGPRR